MKKEIIILLMIIFVVSCKPDTNGKQPSDNFRTGTQGLTLNFLPNTPPSRIYDQDKLHVQIEIKNLGAFNVGNTDLEKIYLSGFDTNIITQIPPGGKTISKMQGKDAFNLQGGVDIVSFESTINLENADRYNPTILATACYQYETQASENVCIDPQPFTSTARAKSCIPRNLGLGSQGAPVAVSSVDVEPRPGRTDFRIQISNVGSGDVFRLENNGLSKCNPQQGLNTFEDINYVSVQDIFVGQDSIKDSCNPKGELRLINGRATLYCNYPVQGSDAYTSTIKVILKYGYRTTIQKTIEIVKTT